MQEKRRRWAMRYQPEEQWSDSMRAQRMRDVAAERRKAEEAAAAAPSSGTSSATDALLQAVHAGEIFGADLTSEAAPARGRARARLWAMRALLLSQRAARSTAKLRAPVVRRTEAAHAARRRDYGRAVTVADEAAALRRSARELRSSTGSGSGTGAANVAADVAARTEVLHAEAFSAVGTAWEKLVAASDAWQQAATDFGARTAADADRLAAAARRELLLAVS